MAFTVDNNHPGIYAIPHEDGFLLMFLGYPMSFDTPKPPAMMDTMGVVWSAGYAEKPDIYLPMTAYENDIVLDIYTHGRIVFSATDLFAYEVDRAIELIGQKMERRRHTREEVATTQALLRQQVEGFRQEILASQAGEQLSE